MRRPYAMLLGATFFCALVLNTPAAHAANPLQKEPPQDLADTPSAVIVNGVKLKPFRSNHCPSLTVWLRNEDPHSQAITLRTELRNDRGSVSFRTSFRMIVPSTISSPIHPSDIPCGKILSDGIYTYSVGIFRGSELVHWYENMEHFSASATPPHIAAAPMRQQEPILQGDSITVAPRLKNSGGIVSNLTVIVGLRNTQNQIMDEYRYLDQTLLPNISADFPLTTKPTLKRGSYRVRADVLDRLGNRIGSFANLGTMNVQ